jgi:hypothetical protein
MVRSIPPFSPKSKSIWEPVTTYECPEELSHRLRAAVMERCLASGKLPDIELKSSAKPAAR